MSPKITTEYLKCWRAQKPVDLGAEEIADISIVEVIGCVDEGWAHEEGVRV